MKIYIAGSLFNEGEVSQRLKEEEILKKEFSDKVSIFNPISQPFNEDKNKLPSPEEIFKGDYKAVKEADIIIADLTNEDFGVAAELGIAFESSDKHLIAVNSDIRLKSANKYDIPSYGMNHFVLGMIESHPNGRLVFSFNEAVEHIRDLLK